MKTSKLDRKMALLRKLTAELGPPSMPDLHIGIEVIDKDGKVIEKRYEQGHSWTRNGWSIFNSIMMNSPFATNGSAVGLTTYGRGNMGLRDMVGTVLVSTTTVQPVGSVYYQNTSATSDYGIIIGTSDEPFTAEDFCLPGFISHGVSPGNLSYNGQVAYPKPVYNSVSNSYTTTYRRLFNNNTTVATVVREVGLMGSNGYSYLVSRDVLSTPINVPIGAQLSISVDITTGSWAALDATSVNQPALGVQIGGGTNFGPNIANANGSPAYAWQTLQHKHTKFSLIVSPVIGGQSTALAFRTTNVAIAGVTTDQYDGANNMAAIYSLGSASPIGVFAADANASNLGGFSDWYIPTYYEMRYSMTERGALLTSGNAFTNTPYLSSYASNTYSYQVNLMTGNLNTDNLTTPYPVRLIRKHKA